MIRRRLLAVWGLALVLAAAAAGLEVFGPGKGDRPVDAHGHGHGSGEEVPGRFPVFAFAEPDIAVVEVLYRGRRVGFARDGAGTWKRVRDGHGGHVHDGGEPDHDHLPGDAGGTDEAGKIAEQFALTARMLADRAIRPERPPAAYGLENPQALVSFYGRSGREADRFRLLDVLEVGDLLTTGYAYYATSRAHPGEVLLLPRYHVALLLALAVGEDEAPAPLPPAGEG